MAINKQTELAAAIDSIHSGDTVLLGGFNICGCPTNLLYGLAARRDIRNLTLVSEDFGSSGLSFVQGPETLFENGQLKKIMVSFLGNHKSAEIAIQEGRLEAEFIPQGTLAERLRAAGAGIGGFYTRTGVGTEVELGKETRMIQGEKYLLELPLRGDVALVKAYMADRYGNAVFRYMASNLNICMAMAAKHVILEAEKIVEPGDLRPDAVGLPGVFVDQIVLTREVLF